MMPVPSPTRTFDLAQVNAALPRETHISAVFADFIAALAPINALAESSPGFVWRVQEDGRDAVTVRTFGELDLHRLAALARRRAISPRPPTLRPPLPPSIPRS